MTVHVFLLNSMQEKLCSMLRDVLKNKPSVDVVKLQRSGGVVSRNAKFRQKSRSHRIRVNIIFYVTKFQKDRIRVNSIFMQPSFRNMLPLCYFLFLMRRLTCADISNRNIFMALQMIWARILISQISVIYLSFELVAGHRPHVQLCQLVQSLLQILQDWCRWILTGICSRRFSLFHSPRILIKLFLGNS